MSDASSQLAQRLERIYQRLTEYRVDAYLVPSSDAHLNEYVPTYQCRRAAISGFTGSAGDVLLSPHGNHLFVDSRYHLQAEQEVDVSQFRVHKVGLADRLYPEGLADGNGEAARGPADRLRPVPARHGVACLLRRSVIRPRIGAGADRRQPG